MFGYGKTINQVGLVSEENSINKRIIEFKYSRDDKVAIGNILQS